MPEIEKTHRRIYLKDLQAFEGRRDASRRKQLDELADQVMDAGLDRADYTGE